MSMDDRRAEYAAAYARFRRRKAAEEYRQWLVEEINKRVRLMFNIQEGGDGT